MEVGDTTLWLVRHGDRFDYANKVLWETTAKSAGFESRDPPLSALGHQQARETATRLMELTGGRIDRLLVSPYLRVLQTAQPLAHLSGVPMQIEEGLAEVSHAPGTIPSAQERFPIFPEVSLDEPSLLRIEPTAVDSASGRPIELYPQDYLRRIVRLAELLPRKFAGKTIVGFSHAASVALAAALARVSLVDVGRMAPCGIFKLVGRAGGAWRIEMHGGDNSGHVSATSATTYPWGFADSRLRSVVEESWDTALKEAVASST
jgi:broad specificity phosphatase PhoE